jgi:hypothetical protein
VTPEPTDSLGLPRGTGIAVLVGVLLLIAIVVATTRIPHGTRPHYAPTPSITTVTLTQTPSS